MTICSLCKKKCSFFSTFFSNDGKEYCLHCWRNNQDKIEKLKIKEEEEKKKAIEEEQSKVMEYKRKCNQCGKVWHSLVSREKQLSRGGILDALVGVGTALQGNFGASTQSSRNVDAQTTSLNSLRKCPNCGSTDYTEKIITYKKK